MTSVLKHGGQLHDIRYFLAADSGKLLLDRIDDVCGHCRIEVEGGEYRRRLGFKRERFIDSNRDELLKELRERGRINLLRGQQVSGRRFDVCAR